MKGSYLWCILFFWCEFVDVVVFLLSMSGGVGGGGGMLAYMSSFDGLLMGYIGMCRFQGHGFQAVSSGTGYINQRVWV